LGRAGFAVGKSSPSAFSSPPLKGGGKGPPATLCVVMRAGVGIKIPSNRKPCTYCAGFSVGNSFT